jgi:hypothetical protein
MKTDSFNGISLDCGSINDGISFHKRYLEAKLLISLLPQAKLRSQVAKLIDEEHEFI